MALFQVSVLKNYLKLQEEQLVDKAYKKFTSYFQHPEIQENIRKSKEEEFQAIFLNELFVKILGYTLKPNPGYDLSTEFKNESNNRKADGAILKDGNAIGVIELKGTNTKHLEGIRQQAFDYKANQKHCVYVITSNFEKLRFYIQDATEFLEFDLFELNREDFGLLWLCLSKENILNGLPLKIKEASLGEEEEITKEFYKDYSLFKRELFRDLVQRNVERLKDRPSGYESDAHVSETEAEKEVKLNLFKKSQKLIDRFLFIFFAEDRGLLPPNAVVNILSEWNQLKVLDAEIPLYERFKQYFGYLNHGRPATDTRPEIYAYNGGLFKPDEHLDGLEIDDHLLYKHTSKLAKYDFESQVDVNILGHIFENSLNEIESVSAEIEGGKFDKQKSKRKKDGVFYTPKYITKYIVENTIGRLCEEKKSDLGFREEEYFKGRKRRQKDTLEGLVKILDDYRHWLLQLTICDPACGSGAFLNQALDFLIKEHRYIDEMKSKLLGGSIILSDIENTILERNIYGVDINEESVEIAKLSLWLRTAQPSRKLNDLSGNIKCGNSLIDDEAVAGNKAFKWEDEFPEVFDPSSGSGRGFDVVIGNPPYVRQELFGEIKSFLESSYNVFEGTSDLFAYFYEKAFLILNSNGLFGFISNTFDKTKAANTLRSYLQKNVCFIDYVDFTEVQIFEGATTYPVIIIATNRTPQKNEFNYTKIPKSAQANIINIENQQNYRVLQEFLDYKNWSFLPVEKAQLLKKLSKLERVKNLYPKTYRGIVTGFNDAFIIDKTTKENLESEHPSSKEIIKPFYEGKDLTKWISEDIEKFIIFTRRGTDIENYPAIKNYLLQFKAKLTPRNSPDMKIGRKSGAYQWFEIQDSIDYYKIFEGEKIIWPNLQSSSKFSLDVNGYYINAPSVILPVADKALLCILNSKVVWEFLKSICVVRSGGYIEIKPQYFEQIPLPIIERRQDLELLVEKILNLVSDYQNIKNKFSNYFSSSYKLQKTSRKLQSWHELEFDEFIKELNKAIKATNKVRVKEGLSPVPGLTKKDEFEWMDLFEENKQKAMELQRVIEKTDKEIDRMVYELYGLTEEEIEIVESSVIK
ncbi:DNA methyltransferase [Salinimicrobium sp. 3283s]|uniref:Eco57I restriction-modification methylase domain-containing protein n=1 Tax=Salinimicrobium sp. 3283s TaxID=3114359 RepID=UPI0031E90F2C